MTFNLGNDHSCQYHPSLSDFPSHPWSRLACIAQLWEEAQTTSLGTSILHQGLSLLALPSQDAKAAGRASTSRWEASASQERLLNTTTADTGGKVGTWEDQLPALNSLPRRRCWSSCLLGKGPQNIA